MFGIGRKERRIWGHRGALRGREVQQLLDDIICGKREIAW
jgi:hypothetical protein